MSRQSVSEKERMSSFRTDENWNRWVATIDPHNSGYESSLFLLCGFLELNPSELLDAARNRNDDLDTGVMEVLKGQATAHYSQGSKKLMVSSLRSFLILRKLKLELLGLKFRRFRTMKQLFKWQEAEKVIECATSPWRNCYRVMLWTTFDNQRFVDLNQDGERIAKVKKDLEDSTRQWIRIEVPDGRKQSPPFTVTIPRAVAELIPVLQNDGTPVRSRQLLIRHFRQALVRAGFGDRHRYGTHQLRSCWKSEATHRGLPSVISESQLGHEVDELNYERMYRDADWVVSEFSKAWNTPQVATVDVVKSLEERVRSTEEQLRSSEHVNAVLAKSLGEFAARLDALKPSAKTIAHVSRVSKRSKSS